MKVSFTFLQRYRSTGMTDYHFYQQINIPSLKGVTKWFEAQLFTIQSINYQLIMIKNEEVKHFFRLLLLGVPFTILHKLQNDVRQLFSNFRKKHIRKKHRAPQTIKISRIRLIHLFQQLIPPNHYYHESAFQKCCKKELLKNAILHLSPKEPHGISCSMRLFTLNG